MVRVLESVKALLLNKLWAREVLSQAEDDILSL